MEGSDEVLMEAYQEGDLEAFRLLFDRYERRLYNFFLVRTGAPERAADLYQETFLHLHRARKSYKPGHPFRPWFFTVAYNVLRDEARRHSASPEVEMLEGEEETFVADPTATPEQIVQAGELEDVVKRALAALHPAQREVVWLSKYEGLSFSEIGSLVGISSEAVKQKVHRAYERLRVLLASHLKEEVT